MIRDSFVFYRSFAKAIKRLKSDEERLELYDAIIAYGLDGEETENSAIVSALMELIVPQIDANNKRFVDGKKGGRPSKPVVSEEITGGFEDKNHRLSKPKPNVNANANENENENVHENDNVNDNANALGSSGGGSSFDDDFNLWKMLGAEGIDQIYEAYPESGGFLLDEVYTDIKAKKKKIKNPVAFVLGYAKKVGWDDKADHMPD